MESDANKRQRGNSITATTNGHPSSSESTDSGSVAATSSGNEHGRQTSIERCMEDQTYVSGAHLDKVVGNPHPRSQPLFAGSSDRSTRSNLKEKMPLMEPPVTKATLSELDVTKIINNPKLRHDINFDPDLHFRPNLDGDKGRRKTQKGNEFWDNMRRKLQEFVSNRDQFDREYGETDWCLPATLKAIRAILETLVPPQDCTSIDESFNVDLLMQQFRKGVADMPKLAQWLSQLLKSHCAPMRDSWVDEMAQQLSDGDRNYDVGLLVVGIKSLLAVLEAMKLDIANHQIRCLRPALIDNTVEFERKFFMRKIKLARIDTTGAHAWYRRAGSIPQHASLDTLRHSRGNPWNFMRALVNLILPTKESEPIPHTFLFDEERLIKLRSDMLDLINLEVCMFHYHCLKASNSTTYETQLVVDDTPYASFVSSPLHRPASPEDQSVLSSPTIPSPNDFSPSKRRRNRTSGNFDRDYSSIRMFMPKADFNPSKSTESSPNSSTSSISTPHASSSTFLSQSDVESTAALRSSLLAILASSPASTSTKQKWSNLAPDLALQVLRSTTTPLNHLPQFEKHLAFHLSEHRSRAFQVVENCVVSALLPELHLLVESYTPKTTYQIFEAATVPRIRSRSSIQSGPKEDIIDLATRIAHLGVLHWQVWGEWFYQQSLEEFYAMILLQT
ncbi:hypothetical protein Golomagni_05164 [Golovinomyces magnicellulatus]|nr:hypothetical protein Golomagni_05164 [Golovinomyces magnicellulatus]